MNINTANTILYCAHWEETVAFYKEMLGFAVSFSNEWFVEFRLNNDARLSIANEVRTSVKSSHGQGITLSLNIDALETVHSALTALGIEATPIKEVWGSRVFYIHDPEEIGSSYGFK